MRFAILLAACGSSAAIPDATVSDAMRSPDAYDRGPDGSVSTVPSVTPGCTDNGCIRDLTFASSLEVSTIRSFVTDPRIEIDNGIDLWHLTFWSDGREVTGEVLVPEVTPPPEGFSAVVMAQPTSGLADQCQPSSGLLGPGIYGGLAIRGMLVIGVDAVGLGTPGPAEWEVRKPSGESLLDAARAASRMSQALGVAMTPRTIIVGHSQGGYSVMAAASLRTSYAPELDVRGFGANAPPAEMRYMLHDDVQGTTNGGRLLLIAYDWQRWYALRAPQYAIEPWWSNVDSTFANNCYYDSNGNVGALQTLIPGDPAQMLTPDFIAMARDDAWIAPWGDLLDENTPWPDDPGAPVRIYQGESDSVVPKRLTDHYVASIRARGDDVDYVISAGAEHSESAFGPVTIYQVNGEDALAWVKQRLGVP